LPRTIPLVCFALLNNPTRQWLSIELRFRVGRAAVRNDHLFWRIDRTASDLALHILNISDELNALRRVSVELDNLVISLNCQRHSFIVAINAQKHSLDRLSLDAATQHGWRRRG